MVAISRREQVAQIFSKPVYVVTDVTLVPLSSCVEAEKGIMVAVRQRETTGDTDEDSSDSESTVDESHDLHSSAGAQEEPSPADDVDIKTGKDGGTAKTSIAKDVFTRRGPYGKFASQWFTSQGWSIPGMPTLSKTEENAASVHEPPAVSMKDEIFMPPTEDTRSDKAAGATSSTEANAEPPTGEKDTNLPLLPKLLRSTRLILSSRSFYFSYDFNITKRMGDSGLIHAKPLAHEDIDPLVCTTSTPPSFIFDC